jgi:hypothetical protein
MFTKGEGHHRVTVTAHVDDLLIIAKHGPMLDFLKKITKEYKMNVQEGHKHSYIGLDIARNVHTGTIFVSQTGYRKDILERFKDLMATGSAKKVGTPCNSNILRPSDEGVPLVGPKQYTSAVMSIMYLARYTRPDLLFTCSTLSTHCSEPNEDHMDEVIRLLKYIRDSPDYSLGFKKNGKLKVRIDTDASHGIHENGAGHGCIVIRLGTAPIYFSSSKIKMIVLSSTEAEHYVLCNATKIAQWLIAVLKELGYDVAPIEMYQDNTSAIWMTANDGNFARSAHLLVRRNFVKESVLNGDITVLHVPTQSNIADIGTKPVSRELIERHLTAMAILPFSTKDVLTANMRGNRPSNNIS